jgi:hypothetical protein
MVAELGRQPAPTYLLRSGVGSHFVLKSTRFVSRFGALAPQGNGAQQRETRRTILPAIGGL